MAWNRDIWNEEADVDDLVDLFVDFGIKRGYNSTSGGPGVIELHKTSTIRLFAGLTSGVRLIIASRSGQTSVEYAEHIKQYLIKLPVVFVGLGIVPLLPFVAFGTHQQYKLLEDIRKELNDYFRHRRPSSSRRQQR